MSAIEVTDGDEIVRAAYWLAWKEFQHISSQTPDEKRSGPQRLQEETMQLAEATLNEALEGVPADRIDICKEVLQLVYDNLR